MRVRACECARAVQCWCACVRTCARMHMRLHLNAAAHVPCACALVHMPVRAQAYVRVFIRPPMRVRVHHSVLCACRCAPPALACARTCVRALRACPCVCQSIMCVCVCVAACAHMCVFVLVLVCMLCAYACACTCSCVVVSNCTHVLAVRACMPCMHHVVRVRMHASECVHAVWAGTLLRVCGLVCGHMFVRAPQLSMWQCV
jgi:hypothetical protein